MKMPRRSGIYFLLLIPSVILFLSLFPPGCKNYNAEDLFPPCDTTQVGYSYDIHPIVVANCLPCHSTNNAFGGHILDTYEGATTDAHTGLLIKAVTHDPSVVPMPRGGQKLPDCDIAKFRRWINLNEPPK
jgi:hypothetical protein